MKLQIKLKNKFKQLIAGFSLIELMVVVAIIGVLASIAVPSYQGYIGKARLTHLIQFSADIKKKVSEYHTMNGQFPDATKIATIISVPTDQYILGTTIAAAGAAGVGLIVNVNTTTPSAGAKYTIVGKNTGISDGEPLLQLTVTYTSSASTAGVIRWDCAFNTNTSPPPIPTAFTPKAATQSLINAAPPECPGTATVMTLTPP